MLVDCGGQAPALRANRGGGCLSLAVFLMNTFYSVTNIGTLYVPTACRDAVFARGRVKLFAHQDLVHLGRISTHIERGGVAVVQGAWEQIMVVMDYIRRHKSAVTPAHAYKSASRAKGNRHSRPGRAISRARLEEAYARLLCWADAEGTLQTDLSPDLPYLFELIGEPRGANEGHPFLVPVASIQRIQSALETTYPVKALDASLVASENVLPPRSQETVECFQEALQGCLNRTGSPEPVTAADIGCGCGVLTLLARQELGADVTLHASDLLSEAVATTRLNIQRIYPEDMHIHVMPPGDLFEAFPSHQSFDLILFNAPWIVARARNRSELAIHDEKQRTLERFFAQAPNFLKPEGTILLGYADASGPKAIENMEQIIASAGFRVCAVFKRRVATHRSKRKWEQIRVYVLGRDCLGARPSAA